MGHHNHHHDRKSVKTTRSHTLPSSPTHSSSSSDFEFTIKSSATNNLCPADDLFYKGQLLPLHLSPRISMVRTLLLSSSSASSSTATTARHSSDSHSSFSTDGCDSSRPSSVTDHDDLHIQSTKLFPNCISSYTQTTYKKKPPPNNNNNNKYFSSLSRFSSVFRKETKSPAGTTTTTTTTNRVDPDIVSGSVKSMRVTAKEVIRKYLKKARPLYQKLSHRQKSPHIPNPNPNSKKANEEINKDKVDIISQSFSGNLLRSGYYPRRSRRSSCISSCPSSMRSSPTHSGILSRNSVIKGTGGGIYSANSSSMEELQSAIQGAIAHCKNSMTHNNINIGSVCTYNSVSARYKSLTPSV